MSKYDFMYYYEYYSRKTFYVFRLDIWNISMKEMSFVNFF